jgi:hypothetical protein
MEVPYYKNRILRLPRKLTVTPGFIPFLVHQHLRHVAAIAALVKSAAPLLRLRKSKPLIASCIDIETPNVDRCRSIVMAVEAIEAAG